MQIAQMIDTLYVGGAQQLLFTFIPEAQRREIATTVVCLNANDQGSPYAQRLAGLDTPLVRFPGSKMFYPPRLITLTRFLRQQRFSIVHTHLTYSNILGVIAARLANIPVVASLHSAGFDTTMVGKQQQLENIVLQTLCQQIIAVGYTTKAVYTPMLKNRQIWAIPNAVAPLPAITPEERRALRQELMGDPSTPMLLAVGRLTALKGYPDLVDAFALVVQKMPNVRLFIAGDGEERAVVEQRIKERQLEDRLTLLGARTDIARLLGSADLFVSSSIQEGLPISVLEAMSVGLPVVGTAVGDIPHILRDQAGVTVAPRRPDLLAEALIRVLNDPAQRQKMHDSALQLTAQYHSPAAWFDQLMTVYQAAHEGKRLV